MSFPENPFKKRVECPKAQVAEEEKPLPIWHTIAVGGSWVIDRFNRNPYLAASLHGRRFGKRFSSRREGDKLRITRVA